MFCCFCCFRRFFGFCFQLLCGFLTLCCFCYLSLLLLLLLKCLRPPILILIFTLPTSLFIILGNKVFHASTPIDGTRITRGAVDVVDLGRSPPTFVQAKSSPWDRNAPIKLQQHQAATALKRPKAAKQKLIRQKIRNRFPSKCPSTVYTFMSFPYKTFIQACNRSCISPFVGPTQWRNNGNQPQLPSCLEILWRSPGTSDPT